MGVILPNEVLIERVFRAPRDLVYRAWTEPEHLVNWYAPEGCVIEIVAMDVRVGGAIHTCIRNPEHGDCWVAGRFEEVVPLKRLAYTLGFSDEEGRFVEPTDAGAGKDPEWPRETTITVTFEDLDGATRVTLHQNVDATVAQRTGALPSWLQMMDRLNDELEDMK